MDKPLVLHPLAADLVRLWVDVLEGYYQIQWEGEENLPLGERFLWTHNHSGWPSVDALVIAKKIYENNLEKTGEKEAGLAFWHRLVMGSPLGPVLRHLQGMSIEDIDSYSCWQNHKIFCTPGEGEEGNFKSSFNKLYQPARFRSGIGWIACKAGVRYVQPVTILGPEESFPVIATLRLPFSKIRQWLPYNQILLGIRSKLMEFQHKDVLIPLLAPLQGIPVQWQVRFHKPIDVSREVQRWQQKPDRSICRQIAARAGAAISADLSMQRKRRKPWRLVMPGFRPAVITSLGRLGLHLADLAEQALTGQGAEKPGEDPDVIPIFRNRSAGDRQPDRKEAG